MPIPKPEPNEPDSDFIGRCMSDETMREEYPDATQRYAVCRNILEREQDE